MQERWPTLEPVKYPYKFFKISFQNLEEIGGGFQRNSKNNFSQFSKCLFLHISYQSIFHGGFHIPVNKSFIIFNFNFFLFKNNG
jgi:hypothetical protein